MGNLKMDKNILKKLFFTGALTAILSGCGKDQTVEFNELKPEPNITYENDLLLDFTVKNHDYQWQLTDKYSIRDSKIKNVETQEIVLDTSEYAFVQYDTDCTNFYCVKENGDAEKIILNEQGKAEVVNSLKSLGATYIYPQNIVINDKNYRYYTVGDELGLLEIDKFDVAITAGSFKKVAVIHDHAMCALTEDGRIEKIIFQDDGTIDISNLVDENNFVDMSEQTFTTYDRYSEITSVYLPVTSVTENGEYVDSAIKVDYYSYGSGKIVEGENSLTKKLTKKLN